jgi:hypothetical protein
MLAAGGQANAASVTLGQLEPNPGFFFCSSNFDFVPHQVAPGASYAVPSGAVTGAITSWSTNASPFAGQMMGLKVFRRIVEPNVYLVVGRDGPHPLNAAGGLNTFPANIPVRPGDLIGVTVPDPGGGPHCLTNVPGNEVRFVSPSLADGGQAPFTLSDAALLNITAVYSATNTFTVGAATRNKKNGTATVAVTVPNPGDLTVTGTGIATSVPAGARRAVAVRPGTVDLTIRATGKKRKKLKRKGKVAIAPTITYTPTDGEPRTESLTLKLRTKKKKKKRS